MSKPHEMKKPKKRKRKLPTSFLDCPSMVQVIDFPPNSKETITTSFASDTVKEIFLDRFVKEIVNPFRPNSTSSGGGAFVLVNGKLTKQKVAKQNPDVKVTKDERTVWKQRLRMGTNQCLRILESLSHKEKRDVPLLLVLARDIYPPTMLAHAPALAKKFKIPLLMLPGKASADMGKALGIKKTSILLFLPSSETDASNLSINSFVDFVTSQIPR